MTFRFSSSIDDDDGDETSTFDESAAVDGDSVDFSSDFVVVVVGVSVVGVETASVLAAVEVSVVVVLVVVIEFDCEENDAVDVFDDAVSVINDFKNA
jgi:hypothetical protein